MNIPVCARWQLTFAAEASFHVSPRQLHAAFCWLLDDDHRAPRKLWSVSPPFTGVGGDVEVTVGTLAPSAAQRLIQLAQDGYSLELGRHVVRLIGAPLPVDEAAFTRAWQPSGAKEWTVNVTSPAALSTRKSYSPWLDPTHLLRSLATRWNRLYDGPLQLEVPHPRSLSRVRVMSFSGRSVEADFDDHVSGEGFVGSLRLGTEDADIAGFTDLLLRWAQFAGIGARTSWGFGSVNMVPHIKTSAMQLPVSAWS